MFTEEVAEAKHRRKITWHELNELPGTTRGAKLVIYELPTERRIDEFRIKGNRINLSLDSGRYIIVHSHPDNWWQRYVSIDCPRAEYEEIKNMMKKSMIAGIKSIVTSDGTRRDCQFPGCQFVTMSTLEAVRHVKLHSAPGVMIPQGQIVMERKPIEPDDDTPIKKVVAESNPKRESLKNQIREIAG